MRLHISQLDSMGLNSDISPYLLNPAGFQEAVNVNFRNGAVETALGYSEYPVKILSDPVQEKYQMVKGIANRIFYISNKKSYVMAKGAINTMVEPWTPGRYVKEIIAKSELPVAIVNGQPFGLRNEDEWFALPNFGASHTCQGMVYFKGFLIAFGNTLGGEYYGDTILISDVSGPDSYPDDWYFHLTDGELDLTKPIEGSKGDLIQLPAISGSIVGGHVLGNYLFLFTESEIFRLAYIGGESANFEVTKILDGYGCLGNDSIIPVEGGLFVVSPSDIYLFNGSTATSLSESRIWKTLQRKLSQTSTVKVVKDIEEKQVFVYVKSGDKYDFALVWNWVTNTWSTRDISFGEFNDICPFNKEALVVVDLASWESQTGNTWESSYAGTHAWYATQTGVGIMTVRDNVAFIFNKGHTIVDESNVTKKIPWKLSREHYLSQDTEIISRLQAVRPVFDVSPHEAPEAHVFVNGKVANQRRHSFFTRTTDKTFKIVVAGDGDFSMSAYDLEYVPFAKRT